MSIVLAVVVSSNNLDPRVGTMGIQYEYYAVFNLIEVPSYPHALFKAEGSKTIPFTAVHPSMA